MMLKSKYIRANSHSPFKNCTQNTILVLLRGPFTFTDSLQHYKITGVFQHLLENNLTVQMRYSKSISIMNQIYGYHFCFSSACVPDAEKDTHAEVVDTVPHKGDHTGNKTQEFSSLPIKEYLDYHNQDNTNANTTLNTDGIKRYKAHEGFGDRRQMVNGARTYFYQNEAQCEKNMETFLRCIEAVAGNKAFTLKSFLYINISCLEIGP